VGQRRLPDNTALTERVRSTDKEDVPEGLSDSEGSSIFADGGIVEGIVDEIALKGPYS
jgi:hypothetical protein